MASAIRSALKKAVPYLPSGIRNRVVSEEWSWSASDERQFAHPQGSGKSLFVGVQNSVAQGYLWTQALQKHKGIEAMNLQAGVPGKTMAPASVTVPLRVMQHSPAWAKRQTRALLEDFSHVLFESAKPVMGVSYGGDVSSEIEALLNAGKKVGFLSYGSDVRSPRVHREIEPYSPFFSDLDGYTEALQKNTDRVHRVLDRFQLTEFMTTPDMLRHRSNAIWLPTLINEEIWNSGPVETEIRKRPLVVHIPSNPPLKGTAVIRPVLSALAEKKVIDYREISGIPSAEMPAVIGDADIVIDQVSIGQYGVASLEAMSLGKLVVSQVGQMTRDYVKQLTGYDVPVIEANADTLSSVIEEIVSAPEEFEYRREAGREYIREIHSGVRTAEILSERFIGE